MLCLHTLYYCNIHAHIRLPTHKVVDCGAPNNPENGDVTFTLTVYNAIAVYSCDDGYNLVPSETFRTCQDDGNWSEDDRACQRKYYLLCTTHLSCKCRIESLIQCCQVGSQKINYGKKCTLIIITYASSVIQKSIDSG